MPLQTPPRYVLRNCTVWFDRDNKVGQASEMQTPNIKLDYENTRNAGMIKEHPLLMGVEIEDAEVKMTSLDPEAIGKIGPAIGQVGIFRFIGDLRDEDGTAHIAEYDVHGQLSGIDFDNWQPGQLASHSYMIKPFYGRLTMDSAVLIEWSEFLLRVNGEDVFNHTALTD